jgi:spore coat polysaccharide biosynthesis predicted glycosyltransferase SpsG
MNRDPILIRVDGTTQGGWEHLSRCLTLAAALQRRRRPTYFLSRLDPGYLALNIRRGGSEWLDADSPAGTPEDLEETIREIHRLNPAAVIVDAPEAGEDYLQALRATGTALVSIDSQAGLRFPSRLIINPLLGPGREAYEHDRGAQLLLGPRFALVRSEIRRVRPLRAQEPPLCSAEERRVNTKDGEEAGRATSSEARSSIPDPRSGFRAVVALGDDDLNNQSSELARLLLNAPRVARVDVLARPQSPHLEKLKALAEACPERLQIAVEPAETAARLGRCHFAITAGNTWSLELACIGVPQLVIVQQEVHWPTAQRLEEEGAAQCLGWHATVSAHTIRQAVHDLLGDNLERQAMARCGRKLIDGRGNDRLVTALEILLHPSRQVQLHDAA